MTSFQAFQCVCFRVKDRVKDLDEMPDKCVVFGCSNTPNKEKGIALHPIPFYGADDPEKKKRRKKWIDFVQLKCAHWEPTKYSAVCSNHFREEDFAVMFSALTNETLQRRLRKDGVGISVFPTVHAPNVKETKSAESERSKRKVRTIYQIRLLRRFHLVGNVSLNVSLIYLLARCL